MTPTSSGTQPFELIVVTNADIRGQIAAAAGGQAQITDGSHLLVFAAWDTYTAERIDEVVQLNVAARGDLPTLHAYYENLKTSYVPRDAEVNYAHAARQAYIALGVALVAAAEQEVDSTPMEGFDPEAVDAILGLKERGLAPSCCCLWATVTHQVTGFCRWRRCANPVRPSSRRSPESGLIRDGACASPENFRSTTQQGAVMLRLVALQRPAFSTGTPDLGSIT